MIGRGQATFKRGGGRPLNKRGEGILQKEPAKDGVAESWRGTWPHTVVSVGEVGGKKESQKASPRGKRGGVGWVQCKNSTSNRRERTKEEKVRSWANL